MTAKALIEKFLAREQFAKKSLGQNFLVNDQVIAKIIDAVNATATSAAPNAEEIRHIIEIGPGPGALTEHLRQMRTAAPDLTLQLLELDADFSQHWREQNENVIEIDALQWDWKLPEPERTLLVSNLPYQIASRLMIERSLDTVPLAAMILMMQREVAERVQARAHDSQYGLLSAVIQTFWHASRVTDAGTRDFFPSPKVNSRILKLTSKNLPAVVAKNKKRYFHFLKTCFAQKRKLLRSNLKGYQPLNPQGQASGPPPIEAWIKGAGLIATVRAEEMTCEELARLYQIIDFGTG